MVDNKEYLEALNVLLPDYFEKVQHFLDCAAYDMEYEFPFLFKKEADFAGTAEKCLRDFDEEATTLSPECNSVCQKLDIANFSPVFESNHTFVVKAVNYFETLAHEANKKNEQRQKDQFQEMAQITKEKEQTVKNVGATAKARDTEKVRLIREEKERLAEIQRKLREAAERRRREAEARRKREEEARRRRAAQSSRRPWWKKLLGWRKLKDQRSLKQLIRGKGKKASLRIAKKFIRGLKQKKRRKRRKLHRKLSKKLILKHFPGHRKAKKRAHKQRRRRRKRKLAGKRAKGRRKQHGRRRRHLRLLEAAAGEGEAKKAEGAVPKPPPKGPPKDPEHQALLKKMKEVYDQIEFMFDKNAPGVVKIADLPLDIDSFSKTFLYGQGINVYLYAQMINIEISRTDLLALLEGKKLGDAMENRIQQILEAIDEAFKMAFARDTDASFIFNLGANDTSAHESEFEKAKEHLMPVECLIEGCEETPATLAAGGAEGGEGGEAPKQEGEAKKEEKPAEQKAPENTKQSRVLEMDRGMDELEGLFDLHGGTKKKHILF